MRPTQTMSQEDPSRSNSNGQAASTTSSGAMNPATYDWEAVEDRAMEQMFARMNADQAAGRSPKPPPPLVNQK